MYVLIENYPGQKPVILAISKTKKKLKDRLEEFAYDKYSWLSVKEIGRMLRQDNVYDPDECAAATACILEVDFDSIEI